MTRREVRGDAAPGAKTRLGVVVAVVLSVGSVVDVPLSPWTLVNARAQVVDTLRADTLPEVFALPGLSVSATRPLATAGGSAALQVTLESVRVPPAPTLEQVLRALPLVQIRQNSRGQVQPALRGSDERQLAVMLDGVPLTLGWDNRTDLSVVPMTAARSIRLVRGLSSVLMGPNVLGGAIEVDLARGSGEDMDQPPLSFSLSVDQEGGRAFGATGTLRRRVGSGEMWVRAGGGYNERPGVPVSEDLLGRSDQRDAFLTGGGDLRLNSDLQRFDGFLATRYTSPGGRWLSFSASGVTSDRGVPPESHVDDPRLWRLPTEERLVVALSGGTGGGGGADEGGGSLNATLGFDLNRLRIDAFESAAFVTQSDGESGDGKTFTTRVVGDHALTPSTWIKGAATYADVSHDEMLDVEGFNEYRQRLWSFGTEIEQRLGTVDGVGPRLSFGVSLDGADTPESGDKPPLGTLWDWGGRLGLSTVTGGSGARLHASVSRRSRFPALRELYSGALGRFEPNPDLSAETLSSGEVGITFSFGGSEVQAVGFHQRLSNGIVRTTVVGTDGISRFQRVNRDEIRSTGIEIFARTAWGRFDVGGDLTLQDVIGRGEDGSEVELEYEPTVAGRISAETMLPMDIRANGAVRFVSDQLCENPEAGGLQSFSTDPNLDLGVNRSFAIGSGLALSRIDAALSVENSTDAAIFDQCGLPQPGRTLRLQLQVR